MKNKFLLSERRNIYLFYALTAVMNFWFIESNWIYFWTRYMSFGQLGWVDAIGFGYAIIMEVPSGAIADLIGRRKTLLAGMVAGAIGIFIITFSGSLWGILLGWIFTQTCFAFFSGAAEAVAYDTLVDLKEEENFDKVISKNQQIAAYSAAVTIFIGGFLYLIDFRLPHILWGLSMVVGIILSFLLVEPKIDSVKASVKQYLFQLVVGIKEVFQPDLRKYVGFFFALMGVYFVYEWGFIKPALATSFGFFSAEQAIILPGLAVFSALIVRTVPHLRKKFSDLNGMIILSMLMAVAFFIAAFPVGYVGLISLVLIVFVGTISIPWISVIVNKKTSSKNRATTLSTVALLTKLPYVLIAITAGKMIENGQLPIFNISVGIIVLAVALASAGLVLITRR